MQGTLQVAGCREYPLLKFGGRVSRCLLTAARWQPSLNLNFIRPGGHVWFLCSGSWCFPDL